MIMKKEEAIQEYLDGIESIKTRLDNLKKQFEDVEADKEGNIDVSNILFVQLEDEYYEAFDCLLDIVVRD